MEAQKIDGNRVYNLFSIGKANRERNALPISHAAPQIPGAGNPKQICTQGAALGAVQS